MLIFSKKEHTLEGSIALKGGAATCLWCLLLGNGTTVVKGGLWAASQEGENRFSLVLCSKVGVRRKLPSPEWPPEEVVFAESTGESGFREGRELKGKFSDLTEDTVRFSGLQGTRGRVWREGRSGVLVQNGDKYGNDS